MSQMAFFRTLYWNGMALCTCFRSYLSFPSASRIGWLLAGGIIYTIGGVIYSLKLPLFNARHKNFGSHEIFHVFIMLGSACHFIVMYCFISTLPV